MQITALYEKDVLKPLKKLDLKEKTRVRITIRDSFYKLIQELGEIEARESIPARSDRRRFSVGQFGFIVTKFPDVQV